DTLAERTQKVVVELRDRVQRDTHGADRGALTDVGAAAEVLLVLLVDHAHHTGGPLGLPLREHAQVGDLRRGEQHAGCVRTGRHAGTTTDTGRGVERAVGVRLRDRVGVGVRGGTRRRTDVATGLDDAV